MAARDWALRAVACFVLYLGLAVWLTWPLGAHLATSLPNPTSLIFDTLHTVWVLSWQTHSLTTAPLSLPDANIYHPSPGALFYGQTAFGAVPYFAPVFLATGNPTLALNVMFLGGVALTASALHLVVYRWTGSHLGGVVAAWTLLMTRWVLWEVVPTAPQYALLHCVPFIVFLAAAPARRFPLALLVLVVLQALVDPVYLGAAIMVPLGLLAAVRLLRTDTRLAGARLAAVLGLATLALLVAFASHFVVRAENPNLAQQTLWRTPMAPFAFPWGLFGVGAPTAAPTPLLVLIVAGAVSMLAAGRTAPTRRAWAHVAFWTAVGVAMSLKPSSLPVLEMLRVPARVGVAGLIGVALLAGLAFTECARRLSRVGRPAPLALAVLVLVSAYGEFTHGLADPGFRRPPLPPYGLVRMQTLDAPLAAALGRFPGPLLEIPVGEGVRSARLNARAMYRSIFHWHPLVNGYDGYYPAAFPRRMALASQLPDPGAVRALSETTGLAMILVNMEDLPPGSRDPWRLLAEAGGRDDLRLLARSESELLFAVTSPTTG
jgi:hypothetical protein